MFNFLKNIQDNNSLIDEVNSLKEKNNILQKENENLKKENEILRNKNLDILKKYGPIDVPYEFNNENTLGTNFDDITIDTMFKMKEYYGNYIIEKYIGFDDSTIVIPNVYKNQSVVGICEEAFFNCKYIENVVLSNNIAFIEDYAFKGCSSLKKIKLNNGLIYIGSGAFSDCSLLSEFTLPSTLIEIGRGAFRRVAIKHITIPKNIRIIPSNIFTDCECLESVVIENGIEEIEDGAFDSCINLKGINFPSSITKIGDYCFMNCYLLNTVELPNSINEIGKNVFDNIEYYQPDLRYNVRENYVSRSMTVFCQPGSYAQMYARKNDFIIKPLTNSLSQPVKVIQPLILSFTIKTRDNNYKEIPEAKKYNLDNEIKKAINELLKKNVSFRIVGSGSPKVVIISKHNISEIIKIINNVNPYLECNKIKSIKYGF